MASLSENASAQGRTYSTCTKICTHTQADGQPNDKVSSPNYQAGQRHDNDKAETHRHVLKVNGYTINILTDSIMFCHCNFKAADFMQSAFNFVDITESATKSVVHC